MKTHALPRFDCLIPSTGTFIGIFGIFLAVTPSVCWGQSTTKKQLTISVEIDRGQDLGQAFGSLFEAESTDGRVAIGAGFPNAYNTRYRADRHAIQFFLRPTQERPLSVEPLPRPNQLCGTYLYGRDGQVYSTYGGFTVWEPASHQWRETSFGRGGTGETMRLANGLLEFADSAVQYEGREILSPPSAGSYQLFYYAHGHLCFYHVHRRGGEYRPFTDEADGFSKLYACPWTPDENKVDLGQASTLTLPVVGETTFAWGQLGQQIVTGSNIGGFYVFEKGRWKMLLEPQLGVSYQLYSTLAFHDRLLLGQYPTGRLFEYDGQSIRDLVNWPPHHSEVSPNAREAQTAAIYGGELFVGVWPWAELWKYQPDRKAWEFAHRMFDHPALSSAVTHPYEVENRDHAPRNHWGQRITSLIPTGENLFVSTSAKSPSAWDANKFPFLAPSKWKSYGAVYRLTMPGHLATPTQWTDGVTRFEFDLRGSEVKIRQDGRLLTTTTLDAAWATDLGAIWEADGIKWGQGIYGRYAGKALEGSLLAE